MKLRILFLLFVATIFQLCLNAQYQFVEQGKFPLKNMSGRSVTAQLIDISNPNALDAISNEVTVQKDQEGVIIVPSKNMQFPGAYALNLKFPGTTYKTTLNISLQNLGAPITVPSMEAAIASAPSKITNGKFQVKNNSGRKINVQFALRNPYGQPLSQSLPLEVGKQLEFTAPTIPDSYLVRITAGPYFDDMSIDVQKEGQIFSTPVISDAAMRNAELLRD